MFYSHEILTSRKHGVATIWLVATLGSKSSLKKVSRRAILDVDVPKACDTIADPDSPMALRLQSSLLYGVSRVFSQQCGYILTDMQSLHDKMRGPSLVMRELQINSNVTLTNDQLNLPTDPTFNFDIDVGLDFAVFDLTSERTGSTSLLSPPSLVSNRSSLLPEEELIIPQLQLSPADLLEDGFSNSNLEAMATTGSIHRRLLDADVDVEEPGIDLNPLFDIDDDGMIVDRPPRRGDSGSTTSRLPGAGPESGNGVSSSNELAFEDIHGLNVEDDMVIMGDDADIQDFSAQPSTYPPVTDHAVIARQHGANHISEVVPHSASEKTETTAEAPQKKAPTKLLRVDQITELSNRQLSDWQQDYLQNMSQARIESSNKQSLAQARRNAAFWVLEQGIGGVATNFGSDREPHPFSVFSGECLVDLLKGIQYSLNDKKRSYSHIESGSEEEEEEAKRHSGFEKNVGRGGDQGLPDDEDGMLLQEDDDVEFEVGRHPASSLEDHPSSMPWNIVGSSLQGSLRGSAQPGFSSSIRGLGLDMGPPSAFSSHHPRLTSASPLVGRGQSFSRLPSLDRPGGNESFGLDIDDFGDLYTGLSGGHDESFELYGPAALVSTQQAAQSQWLATTLENEANNFLVFLRERIATDTGSNEPNTSILFADLLPPMHNSNVVAAQGLLHVLALATKGLINVRQEEAFGDIALSATVYDADAGDSN